MNQKKPPKLAYQADPIRESLEVLGAKWSLLIIRDVAFLDLRHFGEIRRNNPGLTGRVLSRRLKEMVAAGILSRAEKRGEVEYGLTGKGEDAVFILLAVLRYAVRHHMTAGPEYSEKDALRELHYLSPFESQR